MFDRYNTEIRMAKKFKEGDLRMNRHEYDITALDAAVREKTSDYSKMMKFVEGLSKQFNKLKEQCSRAERLSRLEAWVRKRIPKGLRFQEEPFEPPIHPTFAPRSDNPYVMVRDATIAARDDDGDDTTAPTDSQPSEPRGSPRDPQIMPPKEMSAAVIQKLVIDKVAEVLPANRATRNNPNVAGGSGGSCGQGGAPPVRECTLAGFMKYGPTQNHGNEGVVELCRWFEKIESVFGISKCAKRSKDDMKKMMLEEFCPSEEIQRLENELRSLKLRDTNIVAYTQRFNELALLCPEAVLSEKKKVELYIKGLAENIKGETTSSKLSVLNDVVRMAHTLMEQKIQDKVERVAENNKRK
ncbi:putative reverse transcriptase domain-containing protein [Tanacetum coccineum]